VAHVRAAADFPTRNRGVNSSVRFLFSIFSTIAVAVSWNSIPDCSTVVVIFLLTRIVVRVVSRIFSDSLSLAISDASVAARRYRPRATRYLVVGDGLDHRES
jgi:hypothetical protein